MDYAELWSDPDDLMSYTYYDTNGTYCQFDLVYEDDGNITFNITSDPEAEDYGYYCVDGWESTAYDYDYETG